MGFKHISTHEFVQHTSKYLKLSEKMGGIIITHHNAPRLVLTPIKTKTIYDLRGLLDTSKIYDDINEPVLPGYDEW